MRPATHFGTPQYSASWPHMEPHRRSPWRSPHCGGRFRSRCVPGHSCRHTPSTVRCLIGITFEKVNHNCGTHNWIWLGPSSGE
eukprot:7306846-Pyramimonas_sp.AAC.1